MKKLSSAAGHGFVQLDHSGIMEDRDLQQAIEDLLGVPMPCSLLINFSDVQEFQVTTTGIQRGAARFRTCDMRVAIVAPSDIAYGIARMFDAYAESPKLGAFRSAPAARQWLSILTK
jgi:hypothetical protein